PAVELFPDSYAKTEEEILLLGTITGARDTAERLVANMRARARQVADRLQGARRPRVYFEIDGSDPARPWVAGGEGSYSDLIRMAGGENVFWDVRSAAAQVSLEQIIARDPEVIIVGGNAHTDRIQALSRRPGWASITAVRTRRIY